MKLSNRRQIVLGVAVGAVTFTVFGVQGFLEGMEKSREERRTFGEHYLQGVAEQFNAKLPRTIDAETRMDRVDAGPGKRLRFTYSLTHYAAAEVDQKVVPEVIAGLRKASCSMAVVPEALGNDVRMEFAYLGRDAKPAFEFAMVRGDCRQARE